MEVVAVTLVAAIAAIDATATAYITEFCFLHWEGCKHGFPSRSKRPLSRLFLLLLSMETDFF
jgi:hypothetical protein